MTTRSGVARPIRGLFKNYPGWTGAFTRQQADGAIPNGERIIKVKSEPDDAHPVGTIGTVLGSLAWLAEWDVPKGLPRESYLYFVEWDAHPKTAVFTVGSKIAKAD